MLPPWIVSHTSPLRFPAFGQPQSEDRLMDVRLGSNKPRAGNVLQSNLTSRWRSALGYAGYVHRSSESSVGELVKKVGIRYFLASIWYPWHIDNFLKKNGILLNKGIKSGILIKSLTFKCICNPHKSIKL